MLTNPNPSSFQSLQATPANHQTSYPSRHPTRCDSTPIAKLQLSERTHIQKFHLQRTITQHTTKPNQTESKPHRPTKKIYQQPHAHPHPTSQNLQTTSSDITKRTHITYPSCPRDPLRHPDHVAITITWFP
ncbi:hypothetical protein KC19_8G026800 [Ceratodon purpureus]|uniref:Uncharacterized protein n=1 Tax=Ceratodon purpureus TaxID=3225 RepID=A0A8T0GY60_CERPU|nr:hypothetical protein KC19_8G026800 [Ceratodon purpureus]